jgi:hypothetical protein
LAQVTARYDYSAITPETVAQAMDEGLDEAERLIASAVLAPEWPAAKAALEARLAERLREAKPLAEWRLARCRT